MTNPETITVAEEAKRLNVTPGRVRVLIRQDRIKAELVKDEGRGLPFYRVAAESVATFERK